LRREDVERITPESLSVLPATPKNDLRSDPDAFLARDVPRRTLHRYFSSGSTGTPIKTYCTSDAHRGFIAAREVRSFGWAGSSVRHRRSMIGGRAIMPLEDSRPPFHRINWAEDQIYFSAYHISPANARHYVDALNKFQPKLMTGYAHSHYLLACFILEQKLKVTFQPEAIVLSSEKLTAEMKTMLKRVFGAQAYEEYGSVENCVLATECSEGKLHVSPDFGIMEIVDERGAPVPPGTDGRILGTGFLNMAQPLIRYEIGDRGVWADPEIGCSCGADQMPVLQEVVGRMEDVVVLPDGREIVRFHWLFIDLPHVVEGQVIQEELRKFRVRVVAASGFAEQDVREIRRRMHSHMGNDAEVIVERMAELPRTDRGKFRGVISHMTTQKRTERTAATPVAAHSASAG
jgi:phenylacetate-CoA ligase